MPHTASWDYANPQGYTFTMQLRFGDPVSGQAAQGTLHPEESDLSVGDACDLDPQTDAIMFGQLVATATTDGFDTDISTGFTVNPTTADATGAHDDGRVEIAQAFSSGPECEYLSSENYGVEDARVHWSDPVPTGERRTHEFYVVLRDFFSPSAPAGDQEWLSTHGFVPVFGGSNTSAEESQRIFQPDTSTVDGISFTGREFGPGVDRSTDAADPTAAAATPTSASTARDDLAIGFAQADQPCTGEYVVVLASSGDPQTYERTLRPALVSAPGSRYLVTNRSCTSFNQSIEGHAIYAAYQGPFDSRAEACQARAESRYPGAYVRMLDPNVDGRAVCACDASAETLPALSRTGPQEPAVDTSYAVSDVQALLARAGLNPDRLVGGTYGELTADWVRTLQRRTGLPATGRTDEDTWGALLAYCR
jgi:hypothetical protein